jgi:hypothetical protein
LDTTLRVAISKPPPSILFECHLKSSEKKQTQEPILQEKSFELDFPRQFTSSETIADDLDRYFDTHSVVFQLYTGHKSAEWVLQWWQTNQVEYPCVARAARDYLPIPASEVDMERTFSDGRDSGGE